MPHRHTHSSASSHHHLHHQGIPSPTVDGFENIHANANTRPSGSNNNHNHNTPPRTPEEIEVELYTSTVLQPQSSNNRRRSVPPGSERLVVTSELHPFWYTKRGIAILVLVVLAIVGGIVGGVVGGRTNKKAPPSVSPPKDLSNKDASVHGPTTASAAAAVTAIAVNNVVVVATADPSSGLDLREQGAGAGSIEPVVVVARNSAMDDSNSSKISDDDHVQRISLRFRPRPASLKTIL
ncbi:hypothetical protein D9613_002320 [Agrocybe pediades]|uniref:Uncharacterized protein n=1 Tax=Agrocybe pediades TaxID=84607 RepID=A0A8H4R7N7_9AGAR|nr:hypothetical protein D9613_002320 [Agrocybe pediades]